MISVVHIKYVQKFVQTNILFLHILCSEAEQTIESDGVVISWCSVYNQNI